MRVLLVYPIREDYPDNRGIVNKMNYQARAFRALGATCDVVVNRYEGVALNGETRRYYARRSRAWDALNHYALFFWHVRQLATAGAYDLLYLRYPGSTPQLLAFLAEMRRRNRAMKVAVEIPTYPFRNEMKTPKQRIMLASDDVTSIGLRLVVDRIVTFFGQREIYGIPCIRTQNGVDTAALRMRSSARDASCVRFLAVANLAHWHGYDRVITGIAEYLAQTPAPLDVRFDIVGDGPARRELELLVDRTSLGDRVVFHGLRSGADLDAIFETADVAVGALGYHRVGHTDASSLKTREYCARGLPFVLSGTDEDFPDGWPFALRAPEDDSPLDVGAVVKWAVPLTERAATTIATMRHFAEERLTWRAKLAPVLAELGPAPLREASNAAS